MLSHARSNELKSVKFIKSNCEECSDVLLCRAVFAVKHTWVQIQVQPLARCLPLESSQLLKTPVLHVEWKEYIILYSLSIRSYVSLLIKPEGRPSERIKNVKSSE